MTRGDALFFATLMNVSRSIVGAALVLSAIPSLSQHMMCGVLMGFTLRVAAEHSYWRHVFVTVAVVVIVLSRGCNNYSFLERAVGSTLGAGLRFDHRSVFDLSLLSLGHVLVIGIRRHGVINASSICEFVGEFGPTSYTFVLYACFICQMCKNHASSCSRVGRVASFFLALLHALPFSIFRTAHALAFAAFVILSMIYGVQTPRSTGVDRVVIGAMLACILLGFQARQRSEGLLLFAYEVHWVTLLAWYMSYPVPLQRKVRE